jgi:hypothetical protein
MAMIDQLKAIGIEQGKPLNPDAKLQQALKEGIAEAHAWISSPKRNPRWHLEVPGGASAMIHFRKSNS